jgi:hypothetical protein
VEQVRGLFSTFENTLDPDIEEFIRTQAFQFQQRNWSSFYFATPPPAPQSSCPIRIR